MGIENVEQLHVGLTGTADLQHIEGVTGGTV